jgi:eukaryotic-like serine/threonine-protein kinase
MQALLSHYHLLEQIGACGMGVVYRARDEHLNRDVAIKVLPPGTLIGDSDHKRFRKEALALSKLNHPNIATIHDFDTQDGTEFLVEELIDGLSLDTIVTNGPLSGKELTGLGAQLCQGLAAAHEHGIIHRDLKPANIRITPDARLKILDFGLAHVIKPTTPTAATLSETQTPTFAGTLPYMAPEQLLGKTIDTRTDI